jgi:hypothetical protein
MNWSDENSSDLEMGTGDTFCQLFEKRCHDFVKLGRFNNIQDLLQLIQKHDLHSKRI